MDNEKLHQLIDVYDVLYQPWWHTKSFYIIAFLSIIFVGSALLYFFWKKHMGQQSFSYEQIALLQLQKLHECSYNSEESMRDAYFQMTMIMKAYLSKRYGISLINKTDQEIIEAIKGVLPLDIFTALGELFQRAYQIKFAHAAISLKMLYADIDYIQRIIYKTIKQDNGPGVS